MILTLMRVSGIGIQTGDLAKSSKAKITLSYCWSLELYLVKRFRGTIWPRLFSTTALPPPVQYNHLRNRMTTWRRRLDPTHLRALREALEGSTAAFGGEVASGLGLEAWISDLVSEKAKKKSDKNISQTAVCT